MWYGGSLRGNKVTEKSGVPGERINSCWVDAKKYVPNAVVELVVYLTLCAIAKRIPSYSRDPAHLTSEISVLLIWC